MREPVSREISKNVIFTGEIQCNGEWARFDGKVATVDGKPPKDEKTAAMIEMDFFALLRVNGEGEWKVLYHGFAGDVSVTENAEKKFPNAPFWK